MSDKRLRELALAAGGDEWMQHPTHSKNVIRASDAGKWIGGSIDPETDERDYARFIPGDGPVVYTPREGADALFSAGGRK